MWKRYKVDKHDRHGKQRNKKASKQARRQTSKKANKRWCPQGTNVGLDQLSITSLCLSTPDLDQNRAEKPSPSSWTLIRPLAMATAPTSVGPYWRAPLEMCIYGVCVFVQSFECSLSFSMKEGRSTFGIIVGIWAKFQVITKGKWSRHQSLGFF